MPNDRRAAPPWDPGWMPRWDGASTVMMRSRGGSGEVLASSYQYHPKFLLYAAGSPWHLGDLASVGNRILALLPAHLFRGYRAVLNGRDRADQAEAAAAARWIQRHGEALGFRAPNARERARATGRAGYLLALGLNEVQLYDAVGNHFDADALRTRLASAARGLGARALAAPVFPHPSRLLQIYGRLRHRVLAQGCPAEGSPFPSDLRGPLLLSGRGLTSMAAEDGRGTG